MVLSEVSEVLTFTCWTGVFGSNHVPVELIYHTSRVKRTGGGGGGEWEGGGVINEWTSRKRTRRSFRSQ